MIYLLALLLLASLHLWRFSRPLPKGMLPAAPPPPPPDAPLVSFLVPVWNEAAELPGFVASFLALSYPRKELILCVGGEDGGLEVAESLTQPYITVLEQHPGEGKQGALARCFTRSLGPVLYLTDIDCRLDTASVLALLRPILSGQESAVTGTSKPRSEQLGLGAVLVHWAVERKVTGRTARPVDGMLGRNCALTRRAAEAIGGFRNAAPTGTDYRMAQRLRAQGYRIWLEPASALETTFAWPFGRYVRKQSRWLRNVVLYAERPRQQLEFLGAVTVLATPFLLLALLAAAWALRSPLLAFLAGGLLLHALLNRLHYVREARESLEHRPDTGIVRGSALNLLATLAAGVYATLTLLTPTLRRQW